MGKREAEKESLRGRRRERESREQERESRERETEQSLKLVIHGTHFFLKNTIKIALY